MRPYSLLMLLSNFPQLLSHHLLLSIPRILLPNLRTTRSMPHIPTPSHNSLHRQGRRIDRRSDIEVKDRLPIWLVISLVVVDDISDLFRRVSNLALYVPIMAVEWRRSPSIQLASYPKLIFSHPSLGITYANLLGHSRPNACTIAAFGVISLGLPWKRINFGSASSATELSAMPCSPLLTRFQPSASPLA